MDTIVKDTCELSPGSKHWPNTHPVSNASPYTISFIAPEGFGSVCIAVYLTIDVGALYKLTSSIHDAHIDLSIEIKFIL